MSKLANLKSWLTLSDTTQFLSEKLKENVSQAELFRLAMDGHITLSIRILEPTMSNIGQAVKADKAETMMSDQVEWPSYLTIRDLPEKPYVIFTSPKLEHGLFFKKERFDFVSGIFDLRWGDGVSLALRNKYQQLTEGALFDESGSGCYLSDAEGNVCELLGLRAGKEVMTGSDKEVKANCFATGLPVDSEICARIENLNLFVDQINQAEEIKTINNEIASSSITETTKRNYELAIGLLTKALADKAGANCGTQENPNISGLSELLQQYLPADNVGSLSNKSLSIATLRKRLKAGYDSLKNS
jgi:hypothetical protein